MATSVSDTEWEEVVGFGVTADSTIIPGGSGPRIYMAVENMDELLSKVEENGGKVLTPKSEMGEMGFWGLMEDSEGNYINYISFSILSQNSLTPFFFLAENGINITESDILSFVVFKLFEYSF